MLMCFYERNVFKIYLFCWLSYFTHFFSAKALIKPTLFSSVDVTDRRNSKQVLPFNFFRNFLKTYHSFINNVKYFASFSNALTKTFCPESRITFNTLCITLANQSFTVPVNRFKVYLFLAVII